MATRKLQFEGGDVVTRIGPDMTFVLHRYILMAGSHYFQALLSDRWHKPTRIEKQDNGDIAIWELDLYFDKDTGTAELRRKDDELLAKIHAEEDERHGAATRYSQSLWSNPCQNQPYRWRWVMFGPQPYEVIIPKYGRNLQVLPRKSDIINRFYEVHNAIFKMMYGQEFQLKNLKPIRYSVELLANITAAADMYGILDQVSPYLERQFLDLPGLWKDVARIPRFFLGVGFHLQSDEIFVDAMKHALGRGCVQRDLRHNSISEPGYFSDQVYILEDSLRRELTRKISDMVRDWSKILACRPREMTYEKARSRPLSPGDRRIRHIAKNDLMNWLVINVLGKLNFDQPNGPAIQSMHRSCKAARESDVTILGTRGIEKLAAQNAMSAKQIEDAVKIQLDRMNLHEPSNVLSHFNRNCAKYETDSFRSHSDVEGRLRQIPWEIREEVPAMEEIETEPASQEWLDLLGVKHDEHGWQRMLDEETAEDTKADW